MLPAWQQRNGVAASTACIKKPCPVTIAAAPSTTFPIFETKPRREDCSTNRSLTLLTILFKVSIPFFQEPSGSNWKNSCYAVKA